MRLRVPLVTLSIAVVGLLLAPPGRAADADAGARIFKTQCGTCHSVVAGKNLVGPSLAGIVGRKAGEVPGFRYSAANKAADFTWDKGRLDAYLANPEGVVSGTSMLYVGLKNDGQRADVIAYLETLK